MSGFGNTLRRTPTSPLSTAPFVHLRQESCGCHTLTRAAVAGDLPSPRVTAVGSWLELEKTPSRRAASSPAATEQSQPGRLRIINAHAENSSTWPDFPGGCPECGGVRVIASPRASARPLTARVAAHSAMTAARKGFSLAASIVTNSAPRTTATAAPSTLGTTRRNETPTLNETSSWSG